MLVLGGAFLFVSGGLISVGGDRYTAPRPAPVEGAVFVVAGVVVALVGLILAIVSLIARMTQRRRDVDNEQPRQNRDDHVR